MQTDVVRSGYIRGTTVLYRTRMEDLNTVIVEVVESDLVRGEDNHITLIVKDYVINSHLNSEGR